MRLMILNSYVDEVAAGETGHTTFRCMRYISHEITLGRASAKVVRITV